MYKWVLYKCEEHYKKYKSITFLDVDEILIESNSKDMKICIYGLTMFVLLILLLLWL